MLNGDNFLLPPIECLCCFCFNSLRHGNVQILAEYRIVNVSATAVLAKHLAIVQIKKELIVVLADLLIVSHNQADCHICHLLAILLVVAIVCFAHLCHCFHLFSLECLVALVKL